MSQEISKGKIGQIRRELSGGLEITDADLVDDKGFIRRPILRRLLPKVHSISVVKVYRTGWETSGRNPAATGREVCPKGFGHLSAVKTSDGSYVIEVPSSAGSFHHEIHHALHAILHYESTGHILKSGPFSTFLERYSSGQLHGYTKPPHRPLVPADFSAESLHSSLNKVQFKEYTDHKLPGSPKVWLHYWETLDVLTYAPFLVPYQRRLQAFAAFYRERPDIINTLNLPTRELRKIEVENFRQLGHEIISFFADFAMSSRRR